MIKGAVAETLKMFQQGQKAKAFVKLGKMRNEHLLTREEKKVLVVAGEMLSGNTRFYEQLGYVLDTVVQDAERIFKNHYNIGENENDD